jgi:predicted nucleic acid-binding protein
MERFQGLESQDSQIILDLFKQIQFNIVTSKELLNSAYQFAASYQRTVYDSLYVVLAIRAKCKFITADGKLYNAIGKQVENVKLLKDWISV